MSELENSQIPAEGHFPAKVECRCGGISRYLYSMRTKKGETGVDSVYFCRDCFRPTKKRWNSLSRSYAL